MCKAATDSRNYSRQHKTVLAGPGQQQQQECFEKPAVLTALLVAAEPMAANKMTASAVSGWCREKRHVTLRSALMMSEAVAPALSS